MVTDASRVGAVIVTVVLGVLLTGCVQQPAPAAPLGGDVDAPAAPYLQASDEIFDPVDDDVAGTEVCDGLSGRELVEDFDRAAWPDLGVDGGGATLSCGNADGSGWRHIADGHTGDFQELADEVGSSWEDVAWFAIEQALDDPTRVEEYRDDIVNYDVRVELVAEDGDVERAWMVTVGYGLTSGSIITSFPDEVDP